MKVKILFFCIFIILNFIFFQNFTLPQNTAEEISTIRYKSTPLDSFIGPSGSVDINTNPQSLYISFPYIKSAAEVVKINFNSELTQAISIEIIPLKLSDLNNWKTEQSWAHAKLENEVYFSSFGNPARLLKYDPTQKTLTNACQINNGLIKIWSLAIGKNNEIIIGASGENRSFYLYRYNPNQPQEYCELVFENTTKLTDYDLIRNMVQIDDKIYLGLGSKKPGLAVLNTNDNSVNEIILDKCNKPGWIMFGKAQNNNGWQAYSSNKSNSDCNYSLSLNGFNSELSIYDIHNNKYSVKYEIEPNLNIVFKSQNLRTYSDILVSNKNSLTYPGNEAFVFSLKTLNDDTAVSSLMLPAKIFKINKNSENGFTSKEIGNVGSGEVYSYSIDLERNKVFLGGYSTCSMTMSVSGNLSEDLSCSNNTVENIKCNPESGCQSNGSWRPRQMLDYNNKIYIASQEGYGVQKSFLTVLDKINMQSQFYLSSNGWFVPHQWIYSITPFKSVEKKWDWLVGGTTQVPNQGSERVLSPAKIFFWNTKIDQKVENLGNLNSFVSAQPIDIDFNYSNFTTREIGALVQYKNRIIGIATLEEYQKTNQNKIKYLANFKNILFMSSEINNLSDLKKLTINNWSLEKISNFPFAFNTAKILNDSLYVANQKHIISINLHLIESEQNQNISKNRIHLIYSADSTSRIQAVDYSEKYIWFSVGGKIKRISLK